MMLNINVSARISAKTLLWRSVLALMVKGEASRRQTEEVWFSSERTLAPRLTRRDDRVIFVQRGSVCVCV